MGKNSKNKKAGMPILTVIYKCFNEYLTELLKSENDKTTLNKYKLQVKTYRQ